MKHFTALILTLLLVFASTNPARATSTVTRDFNELTTRADTVFKGVVTAKDSRWTGEGPQRHIVTFVTFRVEETYKGTPAAEQTLRFFGGVVGDQAMEIPDLPKFEVGQRAVLFVVDNGRQFCPLVGVAQGRFQVRHDDATGRDRIYTDDGLPVVNTAEIGKFDASGISKLRHYAHTGAQALSSEEFKDQIIGKVSALPR